jgi:hypothetical protein
MFSLSRLLPLQGQPIFNRIEVIGAIGIVRAAPLLGTPTVQGDIGLVAYTTESPHLSLATIARFYTVTLPTITARWPARRSIVVLDNMPSHRKRESLFRTALFAFSLSPRAILFSLQKQTGARNCDDFWTTEKS